MSQKDQETERLIVLPFSALAILTRGDRNPKANAALFVVTGYISKVSSMPACGVGARTCTCSPPAEAPSTLT